MTKSQLEKAARRSSVALIAAFIGLLWLPALDSLFHWDGTLEVNEKRALMPFPHLNPGLTGIRDFLAGLESYYNDHFGFRKRLIYWEQKWKRAWFGESPLCNVIIGRNGWLYYTDNMKPHASSHFTDEELESWKSLLETRRDWLSRRGIQYLFVVSPDKQTIYPEHLPESMAKVAPVTKLDEFVQFMKTNCAVEVLDLRPALLRAKLTERTYLFTDSHWNQYGAFVACQEVLRIIAHHWPDLEPLSLASFDRKTHTEHGGNLAYMLAAADSMPEEDYITLLPKPPLKPLSVMQDFRPGFSDRIVENPDRQGRVLIFGDSFAEGWFPFLGYCFNKVTLYRLYDRQTEHTPAAHIWDAKAIEREQPFLVIDEILENLLYQEDPGRIKTADQLN